MLLAHTPRVHPHDGFITIRPVDKLVFFFSHVTDAIKTLTHTFDPLWRVWMTPGPGDRAWGDSSFQNRTVMFKQYNKLKVTPHYWVQTMKKKQSRCFPDDSYISMFGPTSGFIFITSGRFPPPLLPPLRARYFSLLNPLHVFYFLFREYLD